MGNSSTRKSCIPRLKRAIGWKPNSEEIPLTEDQLRQAFKLHDKDRDGRLNQQELENALGSIGCRMPAWRAKRAIYHNDLDLDGALNHDEIEHLVQYAIKHRYGTNKIAS